MPRRLIAPAIYTAAALAVAAAGLLHAAGRPTPHQVWAQAAAPELAVYTKLLDLGGWAVMALAMFLLLREQGQRHNNLAEKQAAQFLAEIREERARREEAGRIVTDGLARLAQQCQICQLQMKEGGKRPCEKD